LLIGLNTRKKRITAVTERIFVAVQF